MRSCKFFVFLSAFALILALGCQKDSPVVEIVPSPSKSIVVDRGEEEAAAIEAHVKGISSFRDQVHEWRKNPRGSDMSALDVVEKTEIAFNMFLGQPTTAFEAYEWIEEDIVVDASEVWSPATVVTFFDAVKELVYGNVDRESRTIFIISLGDPVRSDVGSSVRVNLHVGINPLSEVGRYAFHEGTRWGLAPIGFTNPTPCGGAANTDIGAAANQQIGVYNAVNAGPGSGGNVPLPGKIVSRIVFGDHSLFGFTFPQGTNYPQVYNIATWGTPLQAFHYNDISVPVGNPDWNCLTNVELIGFGFGNLALADNGAQFVPPVLLGAFSIPRILVCTGVGAFAGFAQTPGVPPISVKFQDHATRHYFGLVSEFAPGPIDDM